MSKPKPRQPDRENEFETDPAANKKPKSVQIQEPPGGYEVIEGVHVPIRRSRVDPSSLTMAKIWDKLKRHTLSNEDRAHFVKSATSYSVLSKHNKLEVYSLKENDDGTLENVRNTQLQLRLLQTHAHNHDIGDVFTVVVPDNINHLPSISETRYNLFEDFAKLDVAMVATSNAWYNTWVHAENICENMAYTFTLLQNNTSEELWNKCLEEYERYHPIYQGGPLMLFLILKRIQSNSENAITHLQNRIKHLKIRDLKGEDVDLAVSLIRSTYKALSQASIDDRNYVPDDFPQTVLKVFQTSSNKVFNNAFALKEAHAQHEADKYGGKPEWPSVEHTCNLATNTYHQLHKTNQWVLPKRSKGYNATSDGRKEKYKPVCWNCGGDHHLKECSVPKDKAKIKAAKDKFLAQRKEREKSSSHGRGQSRGRGRGRSRGPRPIQEDCQGDINGSGAHAATSDRPTKVGDDGTPLILNCKNQYVPDQKKIQQQKSDEKKRALQALVQEASEAAESSPSLSAHIARVQEAISNLRF